MKKNNDWKDRLNVVYSTNPDFKFDNGEEDEPETLEPGNNSCAYRWINATEMENRLRS